VSIVVDASVALKWILDEPDSVAASELRNEELIAPASWLIEAANALWRRNRIGDISLAHARALLSELAEAPVASAAIAPVLPTALNLAMRLRHPVYDCLYLALAIAGETHVVTADRGFAAAVANHPELAGRVRLLGS